MSVGEAELRRFRRNDPQTSRDAAARSFQFSGTHCERILAALEQFGSATAYEMVEMTGLQVVQLDRRLPELERKGLARLLTMDGKPLVRDGYRVWAAVDPCYFSSDEAHS